MQQDFKDHKVRKVHKLNLKKWFQPSMSWALYYKLLSAYGTMYQHWTTLKYKKAVYLQFKASAYQRFNAIPSNSLMYTYAKPVHVL